MSALKSAVMVNIQSHTKTILDFPETGIVRFHGNNSNGKSVLVKALSDAVSNAITRPSNRRSLIRRGSTVGEISLERYDGTLLYLHIALEASSTYAELTRPGQPLVRRYLADKSIPLLIKEFGWHYNTDHGVSLNIHQDVDGFLFVDTKKSMNFDLLSSIRSDAYAEAAAASLEKLIKDTKEKRKEFQHKQEVAEATFTALQCWDLEQETHMRDTCRMLATVLESLSIPLMPQVRPVPDIQICPTVPPMPTVRPVPQVTLCPTVPPMPRVRYPKFLTVFVDLLPDIVPVASELRELKEGTCPTCKRRFVEL